MSDENKEFVQIPTMTFHKPKKKQILTRTIIIAITMMGIGIVILLVAMLLLL